MARLDETILEHLRRNGPATPIEIAQKTGTDSLIVSAILLDAVSQQKIKRSKKKVGSMKLYYFPEQLKDLQKRVSNLLTPEDKNLLQKLMNEKVIKETEVDPVETVLLSNLEDIISGFTIEHDGKLVRYWYDPNLPESKAKEIALKGLGKTLPEKEIKKEVVRPEPQPVEKPEKKEEPQKVEKPEKKKEKQKVLTELEANFRNLVLRWLENQEIDVLNEKILGKGKTFELKVKVPTPLGKQTYILKILCNTKRAATQNDISTLGMSAVSKRTPAIIISSTGFSKTAIRYWKKELEDLVTLVSQEDLE